MMRICKDDRLGGIPPRLIRVREKPALVRIPDSVRKCVVFLYSFVPGPKLFFPRGTAFLLSMSFDELTHWVYMVTAKHVIDGIKQTGDHMVYLRINKPAGGYEWLSTDPENWVGHPSKDEFVDVAAHPIWDVEAIPSDAISFPLESNVTKVENVGPGDDLFMVGLFAHHQGREQSLPIIRVGNIAAMPQEPIRSKLGRMTGYLIEARSLGGLSGSPVFLHAGSQMYLLGLMHGHWDTDVAEDMVVDDGFQKGSINTGIGIVVPAGKIVETLNQPIFEEEREAVRRQRERESGPNLDDAGLPEGIEATAVPHGARAPW